MTQRLRQNTTFEDAIQAILDDIIALHGAEFGNFQLPVGEQLTIVAQRGLSPPFLRAFRWVKKGQGCACGRAMRLRTPVIVVDVESDPEYAAFRGDAKAAGYRSVQSTPIFSKGGELMGVVSTLFAQPHEPTPIEMQTLQTYGVIAADHLRSLLGGMPLAAKAGQMSESLYAPLTDPLPPTMADAGSGDIRRNPI